MSTEHRDDPGEQGLAADEKELVDLRNCQRELEAALRKAAGQLRELGERGAADVAIAACVVWGAG